MNDDDITKLAAKLTKSLATKDDLRRLATKDDLKQLERKLSNKIQSVGETLTKYADQLNEKVENHEKRLKKIESISSIV